jgi:hypothetical protein
VPWSKFTVFLPTRLECGVRGEAGGSSVWRMTLARSSRQSASCHLGCSAMTRDFSWSMAGARRWRVVENISRCGRARRWSGWEKSGEHEEGSGGMVRRLGERQQHWSAASSSTSCVVQEEEERRKRKETKRKRKTKGEACLSKELGCSRQMD